MRQPAMLTSTFRYYCMHRGLSNDTSFPQSLPHARCSDYTCTPVQDLVGDAQQPFSAVASSYFASPVISTVLTTGSSIVRCAECRLHPTKHGFCRHEVAAQESAEAEVAGYFAPQFGCDVEQGA
jgi:hypothetical protein